MAALSTSMPEASIHENSKFFPWKIKVWPAHPLHKASVTGDSRPETMDYIQWHKLVQFVSRNLQN
jgi:hypothetical protein